MKKILLFIAVCFLLILTSCSSENLPQDVKTEDSETKETSAEVREIEELPQYPASEFDSYNGRLYTYIGAYQEPVHYLGCYDLPKTPGENGTELTYRPACEVPGCTHDPETCPAFMDWKNAKIVVDREASAGRDAPILYLLCDDEIIRYDPETGEKKQIIKVDCSNDLQFEEFLLWGNMLVVRMTDVAFFSSPSENGSRYFMLLDKDGGNQRILTPDGMPNLYMPEKMYFVYDGFIWFRCEFGLCKVPLSDGKVEKTFRLDGSESLFLGEQGNLYAVNFRQQYSGGSDAATLVYVRSYDSESRTFENARELFGGVSFTHEVPDYSRQKVYDQIGIYNTIVPVKDGFLFASDCARAISLFDGKAGTSKVLTTLDEKDFWLTGFSFSDDSYLVISSELMFKNKNDQAVGYWEVTYRLYDYRNNVMYTLKTPRDRTYGREKSPDDYALGRDSNTLLKKEVSE